MSRNLGLATATLSILLLAAFSGIGGAGGLAPLLPVRHAAAQTSAAAAAVSVLLNEVELNPKGRDAGGEWVEIYNPAGSDADISNFRIRTSLNPTTITIPAGTVVPAGQFYVLAVDGEKLANSNSLTLLDASGQTVLSRTPALLDKGDSSYTWQRFPDGGREWKLAEATRGSANDPASLPSSGSNNNNNPTVTPPPPPPPQQQSQRSGEQCTGSALCIEGTVVRVAGSGVLSVKAKTGEVYPVDLSLVKSSKSQSAYSFTRAACLGSSVVVDQDDGLTARGKNIVGVAYCSASPASLNQQLLDGGHVALEPRHCGASEFAGQEWAKRHGC